MRRIVIARGDHARRFCLVPILIAFITAPNLAVADEGGVSFWLPGQFGSLAAAPLHPGWSFADIYYHASVSAGGDVAVARQFTLGDFSRTAAASLNTI